MNTISVTALTVMSNDSSIQIEVADWISCSWKWIWRRELFIRTKAFFPPTIPINERTWSVNCDVFVSWWKVGVKRDPFISAHFISYPEWIKRPSVRHRNGDCPFLISCIKSESDEITEVKPRSKAARAQKCLRGWIRSDGTEVEPKQRLWEGKKRWHKRTSGLKQTGHD